MNKYLLISILFWSNLYGQTIRWAKTFGGTKDDCGYSVQQTTDNGYIVTGSTKSYGDGSSDVYLIKTNSDGNCLWTKIFGGDTTDVGESVRQTFDGGYIITGYTYSSIVRNYDVYLIKTNNDGNCLWKKTFGGNSSDMGNSLQETSDSGFIILGTTNSFGIGNADIYLIRTNSLGDTLWTKIFAGTYNDYGNSVQQTSDSGFIITGYTNSFGIGSYDVYLIRTNSSGDTLWTRTYGGTSTDISYSVQQTKDSGFIIAGYTYSFGAGYIPNIYLVKTNSSGDTLWTRNFGKTGSDYAYSVQETSDNGFIIAGHTNSFGAGGYDIWLIKTDSSGYVGVEEKNKELSPPQADQNAELKIIKEKIYLSVPNTINANIKIYDLCGRLKQDVFSGTLKQGNYSFTPQIHEKGICFVKLVTDNYRKTEKLIVLK